MSHIIWESNSCPLFVPAGAAGGHQPESFPTCFFWDLNPCPVFVRAGALGGHQPQPTAAQGSQRAGGVRGEDVLGTPHCRAAAGVPRHAFPARPAMLRQPGKSTTLELIPPWSEISTHPHVVRLSAAWLPCACSCTTSSAWTARHVHPLWSELNTRPHAVLPSAARLSCRHACPHPGVCMKSIRANLLHAKLR